MKKLIFAACLVLGLGIFAPTIVQAGPVILSSSGPTTVNAIFSRFVGWRGPDLPNFKLIIDKSKKTVSCNVGIPKLLSKNQDSGYWQVAHFSFSNKIHWIYTDVQNNNFLDCNLNLTSGVLSFVGTVEGQAGSPWVHRTIESPMYNYTCHNVAGKTKLRKK